MNDNPVLLAAVGGLWGLLFVASLLVFALVRLKPDRDYAELIARTQSWWVMIGAFSVMLLASRNVALIFLAIVSFLALKEYFSRIPTRRADRRVLFWAYLAIPLQYYWISGNWYGMFIIFIPVYMFLFIALRMIIAQKTDGFLQAAATIHWGMMTCIFSISHAAYLLMLPDTGTWGATGGAGLLFYLVFLTQFNDVGQYVWGKMFGRHKVLPIVSPNKTWEGLVGGVATTVLFAALLAPYLTPFNFTHAIMTGALIGLFGFIGDVSISAIKRDLGIKDFSSLIPGHGGVLDRVDSLTFTVPLFFHFMHYFYY
ncbi:phosphatidate cytidylyltransferase [Nitrosomonas mobilis]|uniref:Phosphatidate cytidylyltransferase n=1 Tax=Nitrosomonas mobilis TaxID=51642 RepID=A0A1G5SH41_9PROT|nr:phosphatidate cytidylyltransferase [Nitrosomonas mobilis]SCZ86526.1 putative membrane associated CTP-phosphosubstrate transferase [Nitrosomonas mobilis]HNO75830.1 phosphatidate cytidylyltransferase [Nitrosomonas mobilis]